MATLGSGRRGGGSWEEGGGELGTVMFLSKQRRNIDNCGRKLERFKISFL